MLSCRTATSLASLAMERPLTFRERISLRGHLLICSSCRRAVGQFRRMRETMRTTADPAPSPDSVGGAMPADVRRRLAGDETDRPGGDD